MSKTYKIKVNQGQGESKFVDIPPTVDGRNPVMVKAVPGGKYQLLDPATGYAPENIRVSRSGKDLKVFFEGRSTSDLVVQDYYEVAPEGFNGLIGEAESGRFYEYIPESAVGNAAVPLLADGSNQVGMALGGAEINASGAAVGALVAAAGMNPWLLAPLALLGAAGAAGGGGGSGGGSDTSTVKVVSAKLLPEDDTGPKDGVTTDKTPRITGEATANSDVSVVVNGKTYTGKASSTGEFVIQIPDADALADGTYTPLVTASVGGVKSAEFSGTPFKVDNSSTNKSSNAGVVLDIVSISDDTGPSATDFHTDDRTLVFKGRLSTFVDNGDHVKLSLKNEAGVEMESVYVKPVQESGVWTWTWDRTKSADLADGRYTLDASIVNGAGTLVSDGSSKPSTVDSQLIYIDPNTQLPSVISAALLSEDDTGPKDNVTTDKTPRISGETTGNADVTVVVNGKTYTGKASPTGAFVIQIPDADALADGTYTPVVTASFNGLKSTPFNGTPFKVDNASTEKDPNAGVKLDITSITEDSGTSATDFYTNDTQLVFKGTLSAFTENGDHVKLSLRDAKNVEIGMVYVKPEKVDGVWTWSWDRSTAAVMADGQYTLNASLVNGAGSPVKDSSSTPSTVDTQVVTIDTDKYNNHDPEKKEDPNKAFVVDIRDITTDTGHDSKDFITKDRTLKFSGTVSGFVDNGDRVEVTLKDAAGTVLTKDFIKPSQVSGVWTWTLDKENSLTLADGKYNLQASLVDKAGNPIHTDTQLVVVDNSPSQNGGEVDPNAGLKMLPVTFEDDTGVNTSDYLTNDQFLKFKGSFDKDFVDNGDKVLVQVFGSDGIVISQQYVNPSGKNWTFDNLTKLGADNESVTYTVKSVLVDAAGNTLQATDQSFVIDRSVSIFDDSGAKKESGLWTFKSINYSSDEQGYYRYTTGSGINEKKYTGGLFDLKDLEGKKFEIGTFSLEFKDWAGNSFTIANTTEVMDFTGATMATSTTTTPLPIPGFNGDQLVGSIGKVELKTSDPKEFDMASLYDGIPAMGAVAAANHVDLTQGAHVLKLTMGDVLDLGVKNSFSTATVHKGHLQMRIDGDSLDQVQLDDLVGTTDYDWVKNNSTVTLEGKDYVAYTHETLGLSLFVQTGVTLNLI